MLRGSREERIETMLSLNEEEWNLNTLLYLHLGILDHAEDVRMAAMDALMEIAKRSTGTIYSIPDLHVDSLYVRLHSCFGIYTLYVPVTGSTGNARSSPGGRDRFGTCGEKRGFQEVP